MADLKNSTLMYKINIIIIIIIIGYETVRSRRSRLKKLHY